MAYNEIVDRSPAGGIDTSTNVLIASNPARKYLLIQNVSGVYMGYTPHGVVPSVNASGVGGIGTVVLAPGSGIVYDGTSAPVPTNAFDVTAESGSGNHLTVQEL